MNLLAAAFKLFEEVEFKESLYIYPVLKISVNKLFFNPVLYPTIPMLINKPTDVDFGALGISFRQCPAFRLFFNCVKNR